MRRTAKRKEEPAQSPMLVKGNMKIDCEGRRVFIGEKEINLTAKEFDVLELLAMNPNKVYSRENLLNLIWGYDYPGDARTVDVHIRRLREKIEMNPSERNMYIRSGEWVIISRLNFRKKIKWKFLRSLRFRITVILVIIGIVPMIIVERGLLRAMRNGQLRSAVSRLKISATLSVTRWCSRIIWRIRARRQSTVN